MPDQKLDRIIRRLALLLILGTFSFLAYYFIDRHPLADPTIMDRQIAKVEQQVRDNPQSVEQRLALAGLYISAKRFTDSAAQYAEVLTAEPDQKDALLGRGLALYLAADYAGAEPMYQKVVDMTKDDEFTPVDPAVEESHFYLGMIAAKTGRVDRSIAEFQSAIQIEPTDADALYGLGTSLMAADRNQDALQPLKLAVAFVPLEWTEPYEALKTAYTTLGDAGAVTWADAMIDITHQQWSQGADKLATLSGADVTPDVLLARGFASEGMGDLPKAAEWYRATLAADPNNFSAGDGLARVAPPQPTEPPAGASAAPSGAPEPEASAAVLAQAHGATR